MATVKFNLEADEAKAVQSFLKVVDAQKKSEQQFKRTTKAGANQSKKMSMFARAQKSSVGSMIASYGSLAAAIGLATKAIQFMNAERNQAAGRLRTSEFSLGQLSQLAGGDPKKMREMVDASKATSKEAGIDLNQAAALQFNLESFGIADKRKLFSNLSGTVADPSATAESAVTLQTSFGKGETGGIREIINKGLAASSVSKTTLDQMMTSLASAAPILKMIGASDEESFASLAVLSKARKSSDVASTEIDAVGSVIAKKGFGGSGLLAGIDKLAAAIAGMGDAEKIKFFGRKEGFKGFQTIQQNRGEIATAQAAINTGNIVGPGDQVAGAISVRRSISEIASTEQLRQLEQTNKQEIGDQFGVGENKSLQMIERIRATSLQTGEGWMQRFARISGAEMAKFFGSDDNTIAKTAAISGEIGVWDGSSESDKFLEALNRVSINLERLNGTNQSSFNNGVTE